MEWIDVNFALPAKLRDVLVFTELRYARENGKDRVINNIYVARYKRFNNGKARWRSNHWASGYIDSKEPGGVRVTHWMPLPEQPNKEAKA